MAEFPEKINIEREIESILEYLLANGFSIDDAELFLTDKLPTKDYERLFVWPVKANEGRNLLIKLQKSKFNNPIDVENTDILLKGRLLCLAFNYTV